MKLKLDSEGHAEIKDGHPVYVADDGTESAIDVPALTQKVADANGQAAQRRIELEQVNASLKLFKGLDPAKAREAIAFKDSLGEGIDPAKVEHEIASLKAANAGLTTQVEELTAKGAASDVTIDNLSLGAQISGSDFVQTKVVAALRDPAMFRAAYGENLARDDKGAVIVKDAAGNTIMSEKNAGHPATLDEALPKIVTNPHHLAAQNADGAGEKGSDGKPVKANLGGKKLADMSLEDKAAAVVVAAEQGGSPQEIAARVLAG